MHPVFQYNIFIRDASRYHDLKVLSVEPTTVFPFGKKKTLEIRELYIQLLSAARATDGADEFCDLHLCVNRMLIGFLVTYVNYLL